MQSEEHDRGITLDKAFRSDTPCFEKRGVHLDLKGVPPTAERMVELLRIFAAMRYNVVLIEWEDSFPWTVDERFRSPTAYLPEDIACFVATAEALGIELIPLVQCLGHMENPLSVEGYQHLREIPDIEAGLNPLAPGARELVQSMVDDVLRLMPDTKYFHLGGDEARTFGKHPDTRTYIDQHGKGALYMQHVEPILDSLKVRGIRPILWHDMMIDWDDDALRSLAGKADLMAWVYRGDPESSGHHCNRDILQRFTEHGITLWGATAYKGAEGYDADLPDIPLHVQNVRAWVKTGQHFDLVGVVATAWSRFAVDTIQCNPIDSSLDSAFMVAVVLHDGAPPEGGAEACIAALESLGERDRFEACRRAMGDLVQLRQAGWASVQQARQVAFLARIEPRRTSAGNPKLGLWGVVRLREIVEELDRIAATVREAFDGLIEPIWIEEYLGTRIEPLREELDLLVKACGISDLNGIKRLSER